LVRCVDDVRTALVFEVEAGLLEIEVELSDLRCAAGHHLLAHSFKILDLDCDVVHSRPARVERALPGRHRRIRLDELKHDIARAHMHDPQIGTQRLQVRREPPLDLLGGENLAHERRGRVRIGMDDLDMNQCGDLVAHRSTLAAWTCLQAAAASPPLASPPSAKVATIPFWSLTHHDNIALATSTRPPRNFMSFAALAELLAGIRERDDMSVLVLTGGMPGYFVAMPTLTTSRASAAANRPRGDPRSWFHVLNTLEDLPQPVVAAIGGQCWGAGCELALACTVRGAANSATLALPEVATGIIPGASGTQRLPRAVGTGRALEMIMTGRTVPAAEALTIGLVDAVLPDDGFPEAALEWTLRIAERHRAAPVAAKRAVIHGTRLPFADGLRLEGKLVSGLVADPETFTIQDRLRTRYSETPSDITVTL
jgi:enoyl-CoA hydratase